MSTVQAAGFSRHPKATAMLQQFLKTINDRAVRRTLYGTAWVIEAAVIFALSVAPGMESGLNSGTTAHGVAYGLLSFTGGLYLRGAGRRHPLFIGALCAAGFGALIECVQFFIPYRTCEAQDFAVNLCSGLAAMLPGWLLAKRGWL